MISFKNRTFCASPNCQNDCCRKLTVELKKELDKFKNEFVSVAICYAFFCGEDNIKLYDRNKT